MNFKAIFLYNFFFKKVSFSNLGSVHAGNEEVKYGNHHNKLTCYSIFSKNIYNSKGIYNVP